MDYLVLETRPSKVAVLVEDVDRVELVRADQDVVAISLEELVGLGPTTEERAAPGDMERLLVISRAGDTAAMTVPSAMEVRWFPKESFLPLPLPLFARSCFSGVLVENGIPCALVPDSSELIRVAAQSLSLPSVESSSDPSKAPDRERGMD